MSKIQTLHRILTNEGPAAVVTEGYKAVGRWWRQGEPWELRKSDYVRLDGCRIALDNPIAHSFLNLLTSDLYEKPERESIKRFLDPALPVVELGGCIGVVSCITNRLLDNPSNHVVVEANPAVTPFLEANRKRNDCAFTVLQRGVGYGSGFIEFHVNENNLLGSSCLINNGTTIRVPVITFEDILRQHSFEQCTLICDIEGMEIEMVQREAETIAKSAVMIIMEVHEKLTGKGPVQEMLGQLQKVGFDPIHQVWETYVLRNRQFAVAARVSTQ